MRGTANNVAISNNDNSYANAMLRTKMKKKKKIKVENKKISIIQDMKK